MFFYWVSSNRWLYQLRLNASLELNHRDYGSNLEGLQLFSANERLFQGYETGVSAEWDTSPIRVPWWKKSWITFCDQLSSFLVVLVFSFDVGKVSEVLEEVALVVVVRFPVVVRVVVGVLVVEGAALNHLEVAWTQNLVLDNVILIVDVVRIVAVLGVRLDGLLGAWVAVVLLVPAWRLLLVVLVVSRLVGPLSLPVPWKEKSPNRFK